MKGFITILTLLASSTCLDWSPVDNIIDNAIRTGAFPGASLRIANKTHVIYSNNYGSLTVSNNPFASPQVIN